MKTKANKAGTSKWTMHLDDFIVTCPKYILLSFNLVHIVSFSVFVSDVIYNPASEEIPYVIEMLLINFSLSAFRRILMLR